MIEWLFKKLNRPANCLELITEGETIDISDVAEINTEKESGDREIIRIDRGHDSDVLKVGARVVKVYCPNHPNEHGEITFDTLCRYQELTCRVKKLLEENPPPEFKFFCLESRQTPYSVDYRIPDFKVFRDIGKNLRTSFERFVKTKNREMSNFAIPAVVQEYVPGLNAYNFFRNKEDNNLELWLGLNRFVRDAFKELVKYDVIQFEADMHNIKFKLDNRPNRMNLVITDLAAYLWPINTLEKGKDYGGYIGQFVDRIGRNIK